MVPSIPKPNIKTGEIFSNANDKQRTSHRKKWFWRVLFGEVCTAGWWDVIGVEGGSLVKKVNCEVFSFTVVFLKLVSGWGLENLEMVLKKEDYIIFVKVFLVPFMIKVVSTYISRNKILHSKYGNAIICINWDTILFYLLVSIMKREKKNILSIHQVKFSRC